MKLLCRDGSPLLSISGILIIALLVQRTQNAPPYSLSVLNESISNEYQLFYIVYILFRSLLVNFFWSAYIDLRIIMIEDYFNLFIVKLLGEHFLVSSYINIIIYFYISFERDRLSKLYLRISIKSFLVIEREIFARNGYSPKQILCRYNLYDF